MEYYKCLRNHINIQFAPKKGCIYPGNYTWGGKTRTVEDFVKLFPTDWEKVKISLPEKWYIKPTESTKDTINNWFNKKYYAKYNKCNIKNYPKLNKYGWCIHSEENKLIKAGYVEITFDQFQKFILMRKKLIGYKLKSECEQYREVAFKIVKEDSAYLSNTLDSNFIEVGSINAKLLEKAGVLDLWFYAVYEDTIPKLPVIGGYKPNNANKEVVYYGCKCVSFDTVADLLALGVENVEVKGDLGEYIIVIKEDLEQIEKYYTYIRNL